MDHATLQIRRRTYELFVEYGRAPAPAEVANAEGLAEEAVVAAWRALHDAHALVLDETGAILMANPFSAAPTAFRVEAGGRSWYANCAWDAIGICAALDADGLVETKCPDCGHPISLDIRDKRPSDDSLLFHCLVPAAHWWDDIVFT
ncbi:MAG TPA: organomercurial lyase [Thermoleophilaceae bacterium]|nr:organomercurial lyase [Thermoleophilaceae bacterium]